MWEKTRTTGWWKGCGNREGESSRLPLSSWIDIPYLNAILAPPPPPPPRHVFRFARAEVHANLSIFVASGTLQYCWVGDRMYARWGRLDRIQEWGSRERSNIASMRHAPIHAANIANFVNSQIRSVKIAE